MARQTSGGEYVHGTHPSEQRRLALMNRILNERTLAEVRVRAGDRVLDVGSGLGLLSIELARAAGPTGSVLGIERSAVQIQQAIANRAAAGVSASRVEFRQDDAGHPALREHEQGAFDLVFTRFLLEHVPDPLAVVRHMIAAAKPGGRIVLADDDHDVLRLHPEPDGFATVWRAYMAVYAAVGNDPVVGRRLVQLLHQAGAKPTRNTWVWFGACSGDPMFGAIVENLQGVLRGAAQRMERTGLIARADLERCIESEMAAFARRPDGAVWFSMALAEGIRPA